MSDETELPSDPDLTDPPPLDPELLPSQAGDLVMGPEGLGRHSSLTTIFRQEVATAGGAVAWLTSRAPRALASLAAMVDPSMLESTILEETSSFWLMHEYRLRQCARCPKDGAACVPQTTRLDEGVTVSLRLGSREKQSWEIQTPCPRYQDYQLAARLERSGVDKRFARLRMADISRDPTPNVIRAFQEFIDLLDRAKSTVAMEIMIQGEQAREYGAVLFRLAMISFKHRSFRSVHVPILSRVAMNAMTMKEEYPFFELLEVDVLLLDAVEQDSIKPNSWFRKELTLLYGRRRDQGLATIITTTVPAKEAFPGVSVLRV